MKPIDILRNSKSKLVTLLFAGLLFFSGTCLQAEYVNIETLADRLAESLTNGYGQTEQALRKAGLDGVISDITQVDGLQLFDIDANSLIREVYGRAETHTPGQGERVLAHLYQSAAKQFPAIAEDADFETFRETIRTIDPSLLNPINFQFAVSVDNSKVRYSNNLELSIKVLSEVYSNGNISELGRIAQKAFHNPKLNIGEHIARSKSTKGVILSMMSAHSPPPKIEKVMLDLMHETTRFATATENPEFMRALSNLTSEQLGFDHQSDKVHAELAKMQDELPSRMAQIEQAESIQAMGSVKHSPSNRINSAYEQITDAPLHAKGISLQSTAQNYVDYLGTSFEFATDTASGGGGVGGVGSSSSKSYTAYPSRTGGTIASVPKVNRKFTSAIRSARAARGVAAGGELDFPDGKLLGIAWVANPDDDRFGRVVVQVKSENSEPKLYLSRTLFADSFLAAENVLWGGHSGITEFTEGNILVVMSMDPFANINETKQAELESKALNLRERMINISDDDKVGQLGLLMELFELEQDSSSLPRRIVIHPALHQRELAWSVARVDFCFNDINGLSEEAAKSNGGITMPQSMRNIDISKSNTWQFYERNGRIQLHNARPGNPGRLSLSSGNHSNGLVTTDRGHYSVSLFVFDETPGGNPDGTRLKDVEKEVQPMLDWLSENHHDFIRLNDFTESLSYLRWAKKVGITPTIVDLDGDADPLATPDRVVIGDGPKVR